MIFAQILPGIPGIPGGPCDPCGPGDPWTPCIPVRPWTPAMPCIPWAPSGPIGPCGPSLPSLPGAPAGPARLKNQGNIPLFGFLFPSPSFGMRPLDPPGLLASATPAPADEPDGKKRFWLLRSLFLNGASPVSAMVHKIWSSRLLLSDLWADGFLDG